MTARPTVRRRRSMGRVAMASAALAASAVALGIATGATAAPASASKSGYVGRGECAGLPRLDLQTPPGWCVGLVADAASGLRFPRRVLEVAPGRYWLVDMGSWEAGKGRLLEFLLPVGASPSASAPRAASAAAPATSPLPLPMTVLADRLDRPLGLVRGPDGQVWLGEAGRVSRTPVGPPGTPVRLESVIDGLPADGSHPLKEFVFGAGGKLYLNVGSASDACRDEQNALPVPCPQLAGSKPRAAVYEATVGAGPGGGATTMRPFATGLRNSVALAWVAAPGVLLQGENSIDYVDAAAPPEELNVLREGAFFGWPYCVGDRRPARGYEGRFDCAGRSSAPVLAWPAHAAPLQMTAVPADARNAFAGQLVVAWHGYRAGGHRIVSYTLDAKGLPTGAPRTWVGGWDARPGVRPLGAPTGLTIDSAGRMLIVEDRNKTLLLLVREAR